ncbi:Zn-dependent amino-or carboxypeptidase, M28 family [Nonomuraea solani]|uniref:Zn-dependent amino-or carboxypeptidase, M28 family n=1 Tax=Nonomuraea solani TaxID=1144553 RepID=A0A1H6ET58_9ACTN|nr:DUF4910 domain-containing protein [Nonomuraea solani]SEH01048.1 Zn-dependent amino-or carboxypeptidase, M28 family [Nonomuraea solani]
MRALEAVLGVHEAFPVAGCEDLVASLCGMDRYQASDGIAKAADLVASAAERAGLSEVGIRRHPADGTARWWTFRAPAAWTPVKATLDLLEPGGVRRMAEHPAEPYALATYSAAAHAHDVPLVEATRGPVPPGALVLLPSGHDLPLGPVVAELQRTQAGGLVTDIPAERWRGEPVRGRLELARDSRLYGFSVPPATMAELLRAARDGVTASVTVEVTRNAEMPVVEAVLPGDGPGETLLLAHLCHPAPGANDNASGVAALVGIATALAKLPRGQGSVRFVWGPEFAGTAAHLHGRRGAPPAYVINLDMVGEDQAVCGCPLTIEGGPAHVPSPLPALAADFAKLLPAQASSYAGAVPLRGWAWAEVPFSGASDHALFADPATACPSLALGHWPDPYRHTSLDTPDKVSGEELRRAGTIAGAMALFLRGPGDRAYLRSALTDWALGRMLAIRGLARRAEPRPGVFDPFDPRHLGGFLRHQAEFAAAALPQDAGLAKNLIAHAEALAAAPAERAPSHRRLRNRWPGPFNFEGLLDAATGADRAWLTEQDERDPAAYSRTVALALALATGADLGSAVVQAAYSTWLPIDPGFAARLLDALEAADWPGTPTADRSPSSEERR